MNRKTYPSDVSREQFERILPLLESASKKTRPRRTDVYEVFCAILYLLKSGFPMEHATARISVLKARCMTTTVYDYFKLWKEKPCEDKPSLLEQGFKKMWLGRSVSAMDARFAGCHCGDHSSGNG